jgi:site-specific DNA recombinase
MDVAMVRTKSIDPSKVAIYIRWSTDDQGDGTTLDVQMDGCKHYILSQGWDFTADLIFIDEGFSGGSIDRPAMRALRKVVKAGRVDCVVVFKLDRLSRSVVDTVHLVLEEWDGLCHVKSAREPIDTTNHAGKMFFYMLVSYAEWERAVIKERTFSGKLKRAEEGKNPGFKPPYGYGPGFVVIPGEARVVKQIYELYRRGAGLIAITYKLNDEAIHFRGERLWNESTIKKILENPIYCGDLHYGRRSRNPNHGKREGERFYLHPEEPVVIKRDAVPPILSRAEWNAVQAARAGRPGAAAGTSGRAFSSQHLLTGSARCKCGAAMVGFKGGGQNEYYYRCSARRAKGKQACTCAYIRQEHVDEIVLRKLQLDFGDILAQNRYLTRTLADAQDRIQAAQSSSDDARRILAKLEGTEAHIRKLFREGQLTLAEYREQRADMELERKSAMDQIQRLEKQVRELDAVTALTEQQVEMLAQVQSIRNLTVANQKQLLRHFMASVSLFKQQGSSEVLCDVRWNWGEERAGESQEVTMLIEE